MKANLKQSYLEHVAKLRTGQHAWVRTDSGWCHGTTSESLSRAKEIERLIEPRMQRIEAG